MIFLQKWSKSLRNLKAAPEEDNPRLSIKFSLVFPSFMYLLATKPMVKRSRSSGQSSGGLWVENKAEIWFFFLSNFSKLFNFSAIFVPVPFCELVRIWSSFLSILLCSKYLQSNFEVPGPLRSLSWGLTYTVIPDLKFKYWPDEAYSNLI